MKIITAIIVAFLSGSIAQEFGTVSNPFSPDGDPRVMTSSQQRYLETVIDDARNTKTQYLDHTEERNCDQARPIVYSRANGSFTVVGANQRAVLFNRCGEDFVGIISGYSLLWKLALPISSGFYNSLYGIKDVDGDGLSELAIQTTKVESGNTIDSIDLYKFGNSGFRKISTALVRNCDDRQDGKPAIFSAVYVQRGKNPTLATQDYAVTGNCDELGAMSVKLAGSIKILDGKNSQLNSFGTLFDPLSADNIVLSISKLNQEKYLASVSNYPISKTVKVFQAYGCTKPKPSIKSISNGNFVNSKQIQQAVLFRYCEDGIGVVGIFDGLKLLKLIQIGAEVGFDAVYGVKDINNDGFSELMLQITYKDGPGSSTHILVFDLHGAKINPLFASGVRTCFTSELEERTNQGAITYVKRGPKPLFYQQEVSGGNLCDAEDLKKFSLVGGLHETKFNGPGFGALQLVDVKLKK